MTAEQIKTLAPSVFATSPSPKLSDKYTFVPTFEILENFEMEGWKVSTARQTGKGEFAKHEVRLRNGQLPQVGDSLVEAIISNSHNGMSTLQISTGLHRLVCANGLTVPTSVSDNISIRHMRMDLGEIRRVTDAFAERLPIIDRSISKMETTFLTDEKAMDFLDKASFLRWMHTSKPVNLNLEDLLVPERTADVGNSVWKTFNIIQEKFVRGGTSYRTPKGRSMSMKALKDFQVINRINTGLWELAESYC